MGLWKRYLRWRHSKGFGVHSPYAYRFVTTVLQPGPCIFYSFDEIDANLEPGEFHNYRFQKNVKFLIRVAAFLKTRRVVVVKSTRLGGVWSKVMGLKYEAIKNPESFIFEPGDILLLDRQYCSKTIMQLAIDSNVPILAIDASQEVLDFLDKPIERGLLLRDKKRALLIPRPEMAYVAYDIKLR